MTDISGSRILAAVAILMSSLGGRYLVLELDPVQDEVFKDPLVRRVVLFSIIYLATRDLLVSILVFSAVVVVIEFSKTKARPKQ